MMRILITGGQGQLGQALTSRYGPTQARKEVEEPKTSPQTASPLLTGPFSPQQGMVLIPVSRHELDITQSHAIAYALETYQPDVVINAAAYTGVDHAESEPNQAYLVNETAPGLLAQACAEQGIGMVHISTDYVFDGSSTQPYAEDAPTNPLNIYGLSKKAGEQAVLTALPSAVVLRTSWVFSQFGNNFLKTMLRLGRVHTQLSIVSDQLGGPSYAPHIAQVLLQLAIRLNETKKSISRQHAPCGIYHFAGEPRISWYEFAQEIFTQAVALGLLSRAPILSPISTDHYPTPARRPAHSSLQQRRLDILLGQNNIERDWKQGIRSSLVALSKSQ